MLDLPVLFLIAKIAAVTASYLIADLAKADMILRMISALSFGCVFVLELLLQRIIKKKALTVFTVLSSIAACFLLGMDLLFPLYVVLLLQLFELTIDRSMFYQIGIVALILSFVIFPPEKISLVLAINFILLILFCRAILNRLSHYTEANDLQKEKINELEKKITDLKGLMKTLKITTSLEERNRIAARIHDEVGHGISGSILLLEAAMLITKEKPEKASESIKKAIQNLRESVDEIRTALKEERTDRYLLGINDVTAILEEFKVNYNKMTSIRTSGNLDHITLEKWACIHDNLKECLTNLLKHSNATEFELSIDVFKKIIKVEYRDNGKSEKGFEKDVGLEAIEERTVGAKGRCFFTKRENGFCVTNIFTY